MLEAITIYILGAMTSWIPIGNLTYWGETEEQARARLESIASDVATVATDGGEKSAFAGPLGRVKSALLLSSVASMESGFQKFVDDGTCNKPDYQADRRGGCDGHHAFSIWQIHVAGEGFVLLEDGSLSSKMYSSKETIERLGVVTGKELIADRKVAARVALRIMRDSLKNYGSLCAYSGEDCAPGRHPKADARLDRAKAYLARHPFEMPKEEVASAL
jgi:hypothetical protein